MSRSVRTTGLVGESLTALWRFRWRSLAVLLAVVACTLVFTAASRRAYRSEGRLLVRLGRENAVLDPTASVATGQVVSFPISRDGEVNSVLEMMRSRTLAELVVDDLGPAAVLETSDEPPGAQGPTRDLLPGPLTLLGLSEPLSRREKAVLQVQKKLKVEALNKSNVVSVAYEARSPQVAQLVASKLLERFLEQHVRSHRTAGSQRFFDEQTEPLKALLAGKEAELEQLKNQQQVVAVQERQRILEGRVGSLEGEVLSTESMLAAAEAEARQRQKEFESLPATVVTALTTGSVESTDGMRQQLYTLESRQQELKSKLTEQHPDVIAIQRQVEQVRKILVDEEAKRSSVTMGPSRTHEQAQIAMLTQRPQVDSLRAKLESLRTNVDRSRQELKPLNEMTRRITALEREISLLDGSYRRHYEKLEQARLDRTLAEQRMSNISVFQPATLESKPVRPIVALNLALGTVLGLLAAVGLALLLDSRETSRETSLCLVESSRPSPVATREGEGRRGTTSSDLPAAARAGLTV